MGLRTLCLAWRELEEDEYREWSSLFKEANSTLVDRERRVAEVCQRLEHDFEILGIAAIEDRLQDGVPETIESLRKAGINFWMLTGDKQNTAIQIALSCNFVSPEPKGQLLLINGKTEDEVSRSLERVLLTMRITNSEAKQDVAFVIDGWALEIALKDYKKAFTELAILSRTAICCRVTPSQKAQLVELLKSCDYRTLAIGDGGNDVRMIQQADIGVGISGREGLQAARAADYSIGKFRFLQRLILVHGRYSYNRTAFLSQYSFYKSLVICFIQIFFSFISGVSGTSLFNSVSLMAYNVFYTSIPVLVSVLDKDLGESTVMQHPQILFYCQAGRLLNPSTFAGWFGRSLFHAIVVFVITIHAYAFEKSEMEEISMVALSGCIWLQAFVVALETNPFTILQHLAIWGNLVGFYIINWIVSGVPSSGMYTIMFRLCRQPSYWKTMLLIVAAGMGPVLALKYFRYTYRSSKINILQQAERLGGPILSLGNIEPQLRSLQKDVTPLTISPLSITQPKNRNPVCEPLLSDFPNAATRRSFGSGNETKLGMSRGIPEPKLTAMDAMIDKLTGAIFIFQIVVVIVLGIAGNVWKDTEARKLWYVQYPNESPWYEWVVIPLRFELLCSIMIPISIKVSLDLVKSLYAKFIDWDNEMIDLETGTPAHAANTAISEDLGQVEYIMTDKTGTLTENKMIFRRCYINGIFYGNESGDALKDAELINAVGSGSPDVVRFFTVMAICNTAIPMQSKSGSISYKAQSQDEDALVRAASCLNIVFFNKNANILEINFNRAILQYDVLDTLEFTSDRKRMSVVVKDCKSGKIILLSKGADEAILPYARAGIL